MTSRDAPPHLVIDAAGEALWLLPERAIWWPRAAMLMVADVHLGKAAAFRALGQPVPAGTTSDNLARLDALVDRYPVRELVFLGDFLHARASRTPGVLDAAQAWRDALPVDVACTLIRGNHDSHAGDPPSSMRFDVVNEPWCVGPLALCHLPGASASASASARETHFELAGHVHPACVLRNGADALRLPCFVMGEQAGLLPAFGAFTGTMTVRPWPDARIYAVGGDRVWRVPAR
jgi:DNA ligase-associated metallophosphoesterase